MEQNAKGKKINKVVKIIIGVLLVLLGCLFVARPILSTLLAVPIAGVLLAVMGAIELVTAVLPHNRGRRLKASIGTGMFKVVLGLLVLLVGSYPEGLAALPLVFAVWLACFGVYRIVLGYRRKKADMEKWGTSLAIGVIAIAGAVMLTIVQWVAAMDMIGILIAVLAILYGFVVLMDALVKTGGPKSLEEEVEEDLEISDAQNEDFRRFQEKMKK